MESAETVSLGPVLAGQPVGTWVVLDADLKNVLGAAATPEEAIRQAQVADLSLTGERPVMLQIPDPGMLCLY
jgi:hypothetical protein